MKKHSIKLYQEVRQWIYRNARQIDLAIWQYTFENGSKEAVLSALAFYQNDDGGFGNTLDPDSWNPNSSPCATLTAINILKDIDFSDLQHPIIQGIFKFLESGTHFSENKWLFSIPSNDNYARGPWWTYSYEINETESTGVSAEIASFILRLADRDSELYKKAILVSENLIHNYKTQDNYGDMGVEGYIVLFETLQQIREDQLDYAILTNTLHERVYNAIERDTSKWASYGCRPSNLINSPNSIFYKDNEEIIQKELDYLFDTKPQNDVWDITWSWFELNEKYPKEFAISENWSKTRKAIDKIKFMINFNVIDEEYFRINNH